MDFSQLTPNDQQAMEAIVARKQMKDFSRLFTSLVDRCFTSCVDDFTSRSLTSREDECVSKCTQKFLKHSERVGARFQEENQKIMAKQAGGN